MSDLKDLAFTVQQAVDAPAFESLTRRATRRRRRRTAIVSAGVAIAIATVLLVTGLGAHTSGTPIAPEPTMRPGPTAPGSDKKGQAFAYSPEARLTDILMTSPTRWAAQWIRCSPEGTDCELAAVLSMDGLQTFTPVRSDGYTLLRSGNEPILALPPTQGADSNAWTDGALIRLTKRGTVQSRLQHINASETFRDDEILTDGFSLGSLAIINPRTSTMRDLTIPQEVDGTLPTAPVRDGTGRWWLMSGGIRSNVLWTDDRGKTWRHAPLDGNHDAAGLSVSPNGKTVVATSRADQNDLLSIATIKVSADAGETWQTVADRPTEDLGGSVALDDGTVVMLGQSPGDNGVWRYTIAGSHTQRLTSAPGDLVAAGTTDRLTYGIRSGANQTRVGVSSDRGESWSYFEPR